MSAALVKREQSSKSTALEKLTNLAYDLESGKLIKALLPSLNGINLLGMPFVKTPPNIIRVTLDDGSQKVNPGQTIRGMVKLMISEAVEAQSLEIQLWGRSKTYAGMYNAVRGRVPFESYFKLVDEVGKIELEQLTLTPKVYQFPFQVELPTTVTITEEDWPFNEQTKRFNSNFTQPLPASFEAFSNAHAHVDGSIKYFVTAKLASTNEKQDISHRVPLIVVTNDARALMATETQNITVMRCPFKFRLTSTAAAAATAASSTGLSLETPSEQASPGASVVSLDAPSMASMASFTSGPERGLLRNTGRTPSFTAKLKEKAKDNLLRFRLPAYTFDLDAVIPRSGRVSEVLPIVLKLSWYQAKTKTPLVNPPPPITLTSMKIQLQSRFMVRGVTKDDYNDVALVAVDQSSSWHCVWRSDPLVIAELKDPVELDSETQTESLMFVHPHSFLPAFKTFSIGREYVLTVICNMKCAGELFQAKFEVDDFNILAEGGVDDDFFIPRPQRVRRPGAHYDADDDPEGQSIKDEDSGYETADTAELTDANTEDVMFNKGKNGDFEAIPWKDTNVPAQSAQNNKGKGKAPISEAEA